MKFTKRFLSLLLCLMMILTSFSLGVFADKDEENADAEEVTAQEEKDTEENADDEKEPADEKADAAAPAEDEEAEEDDGSFKYLTTKFETAEEKINAMTPMVDAYGYKLYSDSYTGEVALENKTTGQILFSNPYDLAGSPSSEATKEELMSQLQIRYSDSTGTKTAMNSYKDAAVKDQITVKNMKNGIRVEYSLGDEEVRFLVPMQIEKSSFETNILEPINQIQDQAEKNKILRKLNAYYVLMDPEDKKLSDTERSQMRGKYKAVDKGMAIYVFDTEASRREYREMEKYIKTYCPEYTFAKLEEDHQLTSYTTTQKAPPLFKMALEYTLGEDGLSVRLPANGIRFDEDEYQLIYVRVLPYFGAGSSDYEGYTFVPDGSGALFDFQTLKGSNVNITGKVYGNDFSYHDITTTKSEAIRLPVYGVVEKYVGQTPNFTTVHVDETTDETTGAVIPAHDENVVESYNELTQDRGYFAIIEEGDSLASITTTHGGNLHRYNSVYTEFSPRPSDSYNLSDSVSVGDDTVWTIVSDRKYTGSFRIKIVMLTDDNTAKENGVTDYYPVSYVGMAAAYRDYLVDTGVLTQHKDTNNDIPLYIESFGSVDTDGSFLSIPVTVSKALTTFDNLKSMTSDLNKEGIKNINYRLTGFVNGGMEATVPAGAEFEKVVGGNKGYTDFVKYAKKNGVTVYPEFDLSYASKDESFDGFKMKNDAVKTIDNRYTQKREYYSSFQTSFSNGLICISPSVFSKFYDGVDKDLTKLGKSGISFASLGTDLNSDFDEDDSYNREDSKELVTQLLEKVSGDYDSVMVDGGNAYTWKYADTILNVALDSSHYTNSSRSIPFIGMVLHSYVNFAGDPTNMASDMDYETLKMIENGSLPYFTLSYQNTPLLKDDPNLSKYYSVAYDIWFDDLVNTYKELNGIFKDLQSSEIVNHEFLAGTRVATEEEVKADEEAIANANNPGKAATILAQKLQEAKAASGSSTSGLSADQIKAQNEAKYYVNDGTIVRVTYANGTQFILNYNRFDVAVDGVTVPALSFVKNN